MDVAHHLTAPPRPDGTTQAECMKLALKEAGKGEPSFALVPIEQ